MKTAHSILAAVALLALAGCAKSPAPRTPVVRVSTAAAERAEVAVARKVQATADSTAKTSTAIAAAKMDAQLLADAIAGSMKATPPALQPLVGKLQTDLDAAHKQAADAEAQAAQAVIAEQTIQVELGKVAQQAEASAKREATLADERDVAKTDALTFRESRDRWRGWFFIVCIGAVVLLILYLRK